MSISFLAESPPPNFSTSQEDALEQCINFANFHVDRRVDVAWSFLQSAHELYVAHFNLWVAHDRAKRFAGNQRHTIPHSYPAPLTFNEFVARLNARSQEWHALYQEDLIP